MNRHYFSLGEDSETLKQSVVELCATQSYASFLDSHHHREKNHRYNWIAALGAGKVLQPEGEPFEKLKEFHRQEQDWLFGHLSYDLKNELESLESSSEDIIGFAQLLFFVPETVVLAKEGQVEVYSYRFEDPSSFLAHFQKSSITEPPSPVELTPLTSRAEYLQKVGSLKDHLQYGNIYEINYCIEFASEKLFGFQPVSAFKKLNSSAAAPFSAFYKNEDRYLLCASPERYLQKRGEQIISQPIKGTVRRSTDLKQDELLKKELLASEKERSENVMITDLVRNDLSRTAAKASVKVTELFGIYTFNTVHQMISTVQSELDNRYDFSDVLKTTFPMGSMTGAPKFKAMQLIDEHENFARNLFSGAVGYITPNGDFDFNVVIRSLLYNGQSGYLSARVGSAITIHCEAEQEYEECLLKADNLFKSLK